MKVSTAHLVFSLVSQFRLCDFWPQKFMKVSTAHLVFSLVSQFRLCDFWPQYVKSSWTTYIAELFRSVCFPQTKILESGRSNSNWRVQNKQDILGFSPRRSVLLPQPVICGHRTYTLYWLWVPVWALYWLWAPAWSTGKCLLKPIKLTCCDDYDVMLPQRYTRGVLRFLLLTTQSRDLQRSRNNLLFFIVIPVGR